MPESSPTLADVAAKLTETAAWMDGQLSDELASRQAIAEYGLARVRELRQLLDDIRPGDLDRLRADPRVRSAGRFLAEHGPAALTDADRAELVRVASTFRLLLSLTLDAIAGRPR